MYLHTIHIIHMLILIDCKIYIRADFYAIYIIYKENDTEMDSYYGLDKNLSIVDENIYFMQVVT